MAIRRYVTILALGTLFACGNALDNTPQILSGDPFVLSGREPTSSPIPHTQPSASTSPDSPPTSADTASPIPSATETPIPSGTPLPPPRIPIELMSQSWSGRAGALGSFKGVMSADGDVVAFASEAALVPEDRNGSYDVYVRDRRAGTTMRISVAPDGSETDNGMGFPSPGISADGRFVAFFSISHDLVEGDTNGGYDLFLHDLDQSRTTMIHPPEGIVSTGTGAVTSPALSADGRFVSFDSSASGLVAGDTNICEAGSQPGPCSDVFVYDRISAEIERVSVSSSDEQANGFSILPSLSADGRFVAFYSAADNLVPGDTNGVWDVFVRDRSAAQTQRVSVSTSGEPGNAMSSHSAISADGRYVAFASSATNFVSEATTRVDRIYLRDLLEGTTQLVSRRKDGTPVSEAIVAAISGDGGLVAYTSYDRGITDADTQGYNHVYVWYRETGRTILASVDAWGNPALGAEFPQLTPDGAYLCFTANRSLLPSDANSYQDVYLVPLHSL